MARSSVVFPDPLAPTTAVRLPGESVPDRSDRTSRLPVLQCHMMKCDRGHSAHTTTAQTTARTATAKDRRAAAPAVGDKGSVMVTI